VVLAEQSGLPTAFLLFMRNGRHIAVFVVLFASKAQRLITHPEVGALTALVFGPATICSSAHTAPGGLAGTKGQDNPLTINNKVTTAPYPNLPSLNQMLHAS